MVEHTLMLTICVLVAGTVAIMQKDVFAPISAANLFDSEQSGSVANSPTRGGKLASGGGSGQVVDLQLLSKEVQYAFGLLTLIATAATCLAWRSHRKAKQLMRESDARQSDSPPKPVFDPGAKLRDKIYDKRTTLLSEMGDEFGHVMEGSFEVFHLMSTKNKTVTPDATADSVRSTMSKNKMHHMLVCDGNQLVGVISDRDLSKVSAKTASDLMTRDPITVGPSNCLIPTISTLINNRISCLPVTVDGELKGVLTRTDLLVAYQCTLQLMTKLRHVSEFDLDQLAHSETSRESELEEACEQSDTLQTTMGNPNA